MSYLVLARKYRPLTFDDVSAQEHVTTTLLNALASDRVSHAYLFTGPRGVGKTSTARILARAVNCLDPQGHNPCNKCARCIEITEGRSLDVIEIDGASNRGIDEIRDLRERVDYAPSSSKYKIYIIDEVHMLTTEAFNALLKTLEEPPGHVIFIFATTAAQKVPATILSRCQRFDFKAVPVAKIVECLQAVTSAEGLQFPLDVIEMIARKAGGAMRDALSLLDQVTAFCGNEATLEKASQVLGVFDTELFFALSDIVTARDSAAALAFVERLTDEGIDLVEFYRELAEHYRNLTVFKIGGQAADTAEVPPSAAERYREVSSTLALEDLIRALQLIMGFEESFNYTTQQRICMELLLIRLTIMENSVNIVDLISRLESGASLPSGQAPATARNIQPQSSPPAPEPRKNMVRDSGSAVQAPPPGAPVREEKPEIKSVADGNQTAVNRVKYDGSLSVEIIKGNWPAVVQAIKTRRVVLAPVLGAVEPASFDGSCLVLHVPARMGFYHDKLNDHECRNVIIAVLKELFSLERLELDVKAVDKKPLQAEPQIKTLEKADGSQKDFNRLAQNDPVFGKINELFDPEIIG